MKHDIEVKAQDQKGGPFYQVTKVARRVRVRDFTIPGDAYHKRLFHSNQHGKFIEGFRVKVRPGIVKFWSM